VSRGQEFVAVTEMVLADLRGCVALHLEQLRNGRILVLRPCLAPGKPTFSSPVRRGDCPVMNAARPAVQEFCA
jgi:hypothetical protein